MGLRTDQSQRLVALFVFGALLLTYPMLALFNIGASVGGVPLLYAYLFGAWGLLIALLALAARLPPPDPPAEAPPGPLPHPDPRRQPESGREPR